jgi:hypothetical protein
MNKRSFLKTLLAGVVAPAFLPGAGRIWKPIDFEDPGPIYRVGKYYFDKPIPFPIIVTEEQFGELSLIERIEIPLDFWGYPAKIV